MNKEEVLNTFLLANIPEIITQEEFNDVKKAIKQLQQENQELKKQLDLYNSVIDDIKHMLNNQMDYSWDYVDIVNDIEKILERVG